MVVITGAAQPKRKVETDSDPPALLIRYRNRSLNTTVHLQPEQGEDMRGARMMKGSVSPTTKGMKGGELAWCWLFAIAATIMANM